MGKGAAGMSGATRAKQAARAVKLFRAFRGRNPHGTKEIIEIEADKTVAVEIGALVGVIYLKEGGKVPYCHRFNSRNRPVLFSSFDGSQLYILAGGYRLTGRGIVN